MTVGLGVGATIACEPVVPAPSHGLTIATRTAMHDHREDLTEVAVEPAMADR